VRWFPLSPSSHLTYALADIFKFDPSYLENEDKYKAIKSEILGSSDDESGSGSDDEEDSDDDKEGMSHHPYLSPFINGQPAVAPDKEGIEDRTQTNLVNLRRTIYLTIMNALNYEEAVHKLLKVQITEGEEVFLSNPVLEVVPDTESHRSRSSIC
jgi:pre-mRNA-splicing factor CWC22